MGTKYKDSGIPWIGMIPDDWEVIKLKQIVQCLDSRRVPIDAGDRIKGSYPYWGAGSIVDYVDNYIFDEELILLGEDGAPFFDKTRPVAFLVKERIWVNNHIHVLKTIRDCASYITYCLNTVDYTHYINGSILNKLTQSNMNKIAIILPPLPTQQRIADFLDRKCAEIDELVALQETMIAELKRYKQSVITEAVTKGLDPDVPMKDSGVEWIGEIPIHWEILQTKRIVRNHLQGYYDSDGYAMEGYRLLRITDLLDDGNLTLKNSPFVKETPKIRDFALQRGDFCFARTGGAGSFGYVSEEIEPAVFASYLIRFRFSGQNNNYLRYYFLSHSFISEVNSLIHGGVNKNIHADNIKETHLPIPPLSEQRAIADYLDRKCAEIDELIAIKQQKIEALKEYKKSVIFEYVTGKKEVEE